uniref:Uncharacterized protein n=1 Tax=Vespula pensylvanica TaxID=30213 RepID=A0A834UEC6_VESPE|nr:hypothetical protein H0235_003065 [Vespula pensylvanica]
MAKEKAGKYGGPDKEAGTKGREIDVKENEEEEEEGGKREYNARYVIINNPVRQRREVDGRLLLPPSADSHPLYTIMTTTTKTTKTKTKTKTTKTKTKTKTKTTKTKTKTKRTKTKKKTKTKATTAKTKTRTKTKMTMNKKKKGNHKFRRMWLMKLSYWISLHHRSNDDSIENFLNLDIYSNYVPLLILMLTSHGVQ